jgi:hypothetical protein
MSRRLKIGVRLHPGADGRAADTREQARHAERLGLDGIFVGDHLEPAGLYPESVPYAERGRRTDEALALLPGLIRGETVELPSGASITLSPGAGWFCSMTTPQEIADRVRRLP